MDSVDLRSAYARDSGSYGSHPFIADGDLGFEDTTLSSTRDVCDYLIHFSSTSSIVFDENHDDLPAFEDSDSDTDIDSDSDSEAQYITIPSGSPWWKAPPSSNSVSYDTLVDEDDFDEDDALPSSQSLSDVLQHQQLLVGVFHDELRRIIPGEHQHEDDWLNEVDAKLLLAPVESFEDSCRRSMMPASRPSSIDYGSKPLPDVPVDFDAEDDEADSTEGWEWVRTLPCRLTMLLTDRRVFRNILHIHIESILCRCILYQIHASTDGRSSLRNFMCYVPYCILTHLHCSCSSMALWSQYLLSCFA